MRDDLANGELAEAKDESLSVSAVPLCENVWLSVDADVKLGVEDASPLTDARNGNAVAALNALELPGS